jgi:hypothetical protein
MGTGSAQRGEVQAPIGGRSDPKAAIGRLTRCARFGLPRRKINRDLVAGWQQHIVLLGLDVPEYRCGRLHHANEILAH